MTCYTDWKSYNIIILFTALMCKLQTLEWTTYVAIVPNIIFYFTFTYKCKQFEQQDFLILTVSPASCLHDMENKNYFIFWNAWMIVY